MNNIQYLDGCIVSGGKVTINGVELPPAPTSGRSGTIINGKVYIDGYEFKDGKWKKTLMGLWHLLF